MHRKAQLLSHRTAFTLVELIIVVIVLGLLLAVALPNFFGSASAAKQSAARGYLSEAYHDAKGEQVNNGGSYPIAGTLQALLASAEPQLTFQTTPLTIPGSPVGTIQVTVGGGGTTLTLSSLAADGTLCVLTATPTTNVPASCGPAGVQLTALPALLSMGNAASCGVSAAGAAGVYCWGDNTNGSLGNSTTTPSPTPVPTVGLANANALTTGDVSCALITGGTVKCWGYNGTGEIGDGTAVGPRTTPTQVSGITNAVAVSAGGGHACAILFDGSVKCWGSGTNGQIGDGNSATTNRLTPVPVIGLAGKATAISAGQKHTCAVIVGGTVQCWGINTFGQLGDGTTGVDRLTPVTVLNVANATAVTAGNRHTCALRSTRSIICWGNGSSGQLGTGGLSPTVSTPSVDVTGITTATAIAASGSFHTCALLANGSVKCWGDGSYGQLGDGTATQQLVPVQVVNIGVATTFGVASGIGTAQNTSCALLSSGGAVCWGYNGQGQIGDGTTTNSPVPVAVSGF